MSRRRYPHAPREKARELVATRGGIALTHTVGPGNTGGFPVDTQLFHPQEARFERLGEFVRELAWDGNTLFGVHRRSLVRHVNDGARAHWQPVDPSLRICAQVDLTHFANALWLTQQGQIRNRRIRSRRIPCGVTRWSSGRAPQTWMEDDGLVSGFGRSIVGDSTSIYVSHGIQGKGLSVLAIRAGTGSGCPRAETASP